MKACRTGCLWGLVCALVLATAVANIAKADSTEKLAENLVREAGVTGGLVIHLPCRDGKLVAALARCGSFSVQGLDPSEQNVEAARRYLQSKKLYGRVSAVKLESNRLPYVDNLIRLAVVEDPDIVSRQELLRVLAPLGVAMIRRGEGWEKVVKPWPAAIDNWPQHFYGPDNNAVSHDKVVGPPRHFQWIAEPEWMRSHMSMPSITCMVSSNGRLFTIEDRATAEHPALPGKFALVARDAFNGIVLWIHPFPDWHPITIRTKTTPVQLQRRLAAIGDLVYCTPGYSAPITVFDAATGKILKEFSNTKGTQEFVYDGDTIFAVIGDQTDTIGVAGGTALGTSAFPPEFYGPRIPVKEKPQSTILALNAETGQELWAIPPRQTDGYQGGSLAASGKFVVFATNNSVVCVDRQTGNQLWRAPVKIVLQDRAGIGGAGVSLVLSDQAAYLADSQTLWAFRLEDGKLLWKGRATLNHHKPADVFINAGLVWSSYSIGYDPLTGEVVRTLQQLMTGPMGHDRCYRNRITERFYINTKTGGSDFVDFATSAEFPHPWVRSTCGIGHMPANGLLYCGPAACSCCSWVMLNAFNALATEPGLKKPDQPIPVPRKTQLVKGAAYGEKLFGEQASEDDWPTYRHDASRSGATKSSGPKTLELLWQTKLLTRASAPSIAAGMVFVADIDAHTVYALDLKDGHICWAFVTNARVDSPPTFYKGMVIFGSHDGWVYCLRACDGSLVWKFRDLPDRTICAYEQPESAWPVCGSVLVKDGVVYFAAGRNSFLDGGIFIYALDPFTGRVINSRHMYGPFDEQGFPIITSRIANGSAIDGLKNDVMMADGNLLYIRQQAFRTDLTPLGPEDPRPPHLIANPSFLEWIPHHRTFWTIDTTLRYDITAGRQAAHGDILVMDGRRFFEVRGYTPARISPFDPRENGYTLFAGEYVPAEEVIVEKRRNRPDRKLRIVSRAKKLWSTNIPLTGKALALAGDVIYVAGTPAVFPPDDLDAAYEGKLGGVLWAGNAETGDKLTSVKLPAAPSWDAIAVARGRLVIGLQDGSVLCFGDPQN